jgi:hypothetical protein
MTDVMAIYDGLIATTDIPLRRHVVVLDQGKYVGHVNCWIAISKNGNRSVSMQGIYSSLFEQLSRKCTKMPKGVAKLLINAISQWGLENRCDWYLVPTPIGLMPGILRKMGFKEYQSHYYLKLTAGDDYFDYTMLPQTTIEVNLPADEQLLRCY